MIARSLPIAALALLCGCAAPYFAGQTGRVTPRKDVRVALATGYNFSSSAADVIWDAEDLVGGVERVACPTEEDPRRRCFRGEDLAPIADAAMRLALVSPFASHSEISVRYGAFDRVDAGFHLSPDGQRLDVGLQAFGPAERDAPGWAGALVVGLGRRSIGTIGDVLELLGGEAALTDVDAVFVSGRQFGQAAQLYVGGRYMLTRWASRSSRTCRSCTRASPR